MESRVELFARIRRDARVEGLSIRELARRHGVGRPTVRQALVQAEPPRRRPRVRSAPRLDPFKGAVDAMLVADLDAPRKQKHTARRVFARLAEEHGASELSYSTVRNYVRVRRAEIDAEVGRGREVLVPQEHAPGAEAEVDFGEVWVVLAGVKTKCHLFTFRLSASGRAVQPGLFHAGAGSFPRGSHRRVRGGRRCPDPTHQVRQPHRGGVHRALRQGPPAGGEPAVGAVPIALRVRRVLLPPRD